MDNYEKRLVSEYYWLWQTVDALTHSIEKGDEFKEKVGDTQFELIKQECQAMAELKEIVGKRIEDLGLIEKMNQEGWRDYDDDFDDDEMLTREKVLSKACHDCYKEMYAKSQPVGDYDEYVRQYKAGELRDDDKDRVYNRHYLSRDEYEYIIDKYVDAYGMKEKWSDYVDTVKAYFGDDVSKDKYIPEWVDENGMKHPGYRGYEKLEHFKDVVAHILKPYIFDEGLRHAIGIDIYKAVMDRIETCKNFYRFDREESGFHIQMGLGASPTCNKETVINYWKEKGVDVEIEDRDPDSFWSKDMYGDDYEDDYDEVYDVTDEAEEIQQEDNQQ